VLFITGYAENAAIRSGFLGTKMAMITKPFSLDVLATRIGEMLGNKTKGSVRRSNPGRWLRCKYHGVVRIHENKVNHGCENALPACGFPRASDA
jgi:hypothetical protein